MSKKYQNGKQRMLQKYGPKRAKAYGAWVGMRCRPKQAEKGVPRYESYLGIEVSGVFNSFDAFLDEVGDPPSIDHSLDRIDTFKGYVPGNLRWATNTEQRHNRKEPLKLCPVTAENIRAIYTHCKVSQKKLADLYGVSQVMISAITRKAVY